ncbi:ATP-binding protein [Alkalihalobacterium elongatum]|uniref:ATP-binding protein n=1 Tax=Alkalihalobacterium elongatum TaxID=2675466 RepID=UPI001C1FF009|nr:ATP-binding protein [Alkalihalobacterium elongatum]
MDILKDLVFNFFFMFVCYCVFISFQLKNRGAFNLNKVSLNFFAALAVILCMSFPIQTAQGFLFDLRLVPIALAGLYGGWRTIFLLVSILIGYRLLLGGDGVSLAIFVALFHGLFIGSLSRWFLSLVYRQRILLSLAVGFITPVPCLVAIGIVYNEVLSSVLIFNIVLLHLLTITFFVALSETIHKLRNLNEHVIRSEKMEIVSHVASSFTHEIRNPMTTVKGFLQLMKSPSIKRKELDKYVSIAISEVERAENIITEYLSFTKPTNGELEIIDGDDLVQSSIEVIRPLANANCVDIKTNSLTFSIKANKQKLQQALINLYKNAIEAMPNGGTLYVSLEAKNGFIFLTIKDTGIGMSEEQLSRLGEPYFSSKGDKGTGLGMMVVYNIVEAIGGTINVVSQPGKGTAFILKLPISSIDHEKKLLKDEQQELSNH